jgi:hypothetical protein
MLDENSENQLDLAYHTSCNYQNHGTIILASSRLTKFEMVREANDDYTYRACNLRCAVQPFSGLDASVT